MEYKKDFDGWNETKKWLHNRRDAHFFLEKEIWWCSLGVNIGSEQDGKRNLYRRPVLIVKKISPRTFIGIPLTTVLKEDYAHVSFYFNYNISTAIISQVRILDKKR